MNYRWVIGSLGLEYRATVGNGHTGQLASSTQVKGADVLYEALGAGGSWKGKQLNLTAKVRCVEPASAPLVNVTVWQTDPSGTVAGRINEQATQASGVFDEHGFADIDILVTFD
jgi:hypothetical protein